jgi:hypothetical protein
MPMENPQDPMGQMGGMSMTPYGNPPQGKEKGGSGLWKNAAMGVAGPLLALLGSKLSGGSLPFSEGLAHLGRGFANTRFDMSMQDRDRKFRQEDDFIRMAHQEMQSLGEIDPEVMKDMPELQKLQMKYAEALGKESDGGTIITGKEASQIVALAGLARNRMGKGKELTDYARSRRQGAAQAEGRRDVEVGELETAIGAQRRGLEGGMNMGEPLYPGAQDPGADRAGAERMYGQRVMEPYQRVPTQLSSGQTVQLPPTQAAMYDRYNLQAKQKQLGQQALLERMRNARAAGKRADANLDLRRASVFGSLALRMLSPNSGFEIPEGLQSADQIMGWALDLAEAVGDQMTTPPPGGGGTPSVTPGGDFIDVPGVGKVKRSQ